jgi:hypothetical protein
MALDLKSGPPTLLALVSLGLGLTAEAAADGDFAGARMSLAHVRELTKRPALVKLRPSLARLAGALTGPEPGAGEWRAAVDATFRAIESMGPTPTANNP